MGESPISILRDNDGTADNARWAPTRDGCSLYVTESGTDSSPVVLFVHGNGASHLCWSYQFGDTTLRCRYRMVAYDQRGMGRSDKPDADYTNPDVWADDLRSVIDDLDAARVILVAWSYGGFVVCDYLRQYGQGKIAGLALVAAPTRVGVPSADDMFAADFLRLVPDFTADDFNTAVPGVARVIESFSAQGLRYEDYCAAIGAALAQSGSMRKTMLTERVVDNDDVLRELTIPVAIFQGERDAVVTPKTAEIHTELIPHAQLFQYPSSGHAVQWDEAEQFATDLRGFISTCDQ